MPHCAPARPGVRVSSHVLVLVLLLVLETLSVRRGLFRVFGPVRTVLDKAALAAGKRAYWLIPMFWPKA